jgi:hypothetical protein
MTANRRPESAIRISARGVESEQFTGLMDPDAWSTVRLWHARVEFPLENTFDSVTNLFPFHVR